MQLNTDTKFLELVRKTKQRVYDFLYLMLPIPEEVDEIMVASFRWFGSSKNAEPSELALFSRAWQNLQAVLRSEVPESSMGRDTRVLSSFDDNLLTQKKLSKDQQTILLKRMATIDADFKAPVILKDVLKFEDEEILKILGLRWGVYRHRLHRGRLEVKDALKGKNAPVFSLAKPAWVT